MELYTLNINVNKQRLSFGENKPEIFSGDQSIDFVEFTFEDDMWNFPDIWAIFSRQKGTSYQVSLEDNKVMIPAEVMQKRGYVYIGLMATDGDNVQTSSVLQYSIGQGSTNVDAITPSASIYEQFLADLDAYQTAVADLDDIESRITTAEGNVSMIEQAVTDLNEQLDDINVDISTINGQITTIQSNIGTAQGDIVSIQNGINTLNGQVAGLDTAVGTLSNRVTALQSSVTSLEGRLTTAGNTLTDFEGRLTTAGTTLTNLEGRLTTAGTTLTNLEGSISDAENDIQTVQDDIETIQSDIEDIQTAIEQNNVVTDVTAEGISLVDNHIADLSFMCVTDTASGDVASFPDGSGLAMKKAEVSLEPIQDLHGYDSPWPAGGGKNLFPFVDGIDFTVASVRFTTQNGNLYINGTASSGISSVGQNFKDNFAVTLAAGTYYFSCTSPTGTVPVLNKLSDNTNIRTGQGSFTLAEETTIYFGLYAPADKAFSGMYQVQIEVGSSATSYAPYENICPIDGYEDVGLYSDSKYGGLIEWNQMIANGNFETNTIWSARNGSISISNNIATVTANSGASQPGLVGGRVNVEKDDIYLIGATVKLNEANRISLSISGGNSSGSVSTKVNVPSNEWTRCEGLWKYAQNLAGAPYYLADLTSTNLILQFKNCILYNLTQMFGATKADEIYAMEQAEVGAGIAYCKSLFPNDYYEYNAGEVMTVGQVNGDETVEVHTDLVTNVWDEEWEVGGLNASTGANWNTTDRIRSKNYVPILPTTAYYFKYPTSGVNMTVCFYDDSKQFISSTEPTNAVYTTPNNAHYLRFATYAQYGTTYNNDISINYPAISTDKVYGGTVDLASGMLTVNYAYAILDGSSDEGWTLYSAFNGYTAVGINDMKSGVRQQGWCDKLQTSTSTATGQTNACWFGSYSRYFYVIGVFENMGSTVEDFKTYLSTNPLQVVYPLATPQTYQLTPQQIQTLIGTNNVWSEDGTIEVEYIANLKDYIDKKINA